MKQKELLKSTTQTTFFNNISRTNAVRDKGLMIKTTIVNEMSIIVNFLETKIRHFVPTKITGSSINCTFTRDIEGRIPSALL